MILRLIYVILRLIYVILRLIYVIPRLIYVIPRLIYVILRLIYVTPPAGKQWENFAMEQAEKWTEQYDSYIKCNKPLIVISYDQLMDPDQVQKQLIHLSHFLHVPIKQSVLNCLVDKTTEEDLYPQYKPRPLRYGFNPFELLPVDKQHLLQKLENSTEQLVIRTREGFLPRIHV